MTFPNSNAESGLGDPGVKKMYCSNEQTGEILKKNYLVNITSAEISDQDFLKLNLFLQDSDNLISKTVRDLSVEKIPILKQKLGELFSNLIADKYDLTILDINKDNTCKVRFVNYSARKVFTFDNFPANLLTISANNSTLQENNMSDSLILDFDAYKYNGVIRPSTEDKLGRAQTALVNAIGHIS